MYGYDSKIEEFKNPIKAYYKDGKVLYALRDAKKKLN